MGDQIQDGPVLNTGPSGVAENQKHYVLYSSKNYIILTGRETRTLTHKARDPKSRASTNSAIPALIIINNPDAKRPLIYNRDNFFFSAPESFPIERPLE